MAKYRAAAMTLGETIGAPVVEDRAVFAMTGGGRVDNRPTWVFLWEGITVPIGFKIAIAPPPPPEV